MQRKIKGQLSVVWTWFTIVVVALSYSDISQLCREKWKETMNMEKTNYVEQNEKKQWTWRNKLEIQSGQNRESWICFELTFFTREFCYNRYQKVQPFSLLLVVSLYKIFLSVQRSCLTPSVRILFSKRCQVFVFYLN